MARLACFTFSGNTITQSNVSASEGSRVEARADGPAEAHGFYIAGSTATRSALLLRDSAVAIAGGAANASSLWCISAATFSTYFWLVADHTNVAMETASGGGGASLHVVYVPTAMKSGEPSGALYWRGSTVALEGGTSSAAAVTSGYVCGGAGCPTMAKRIDDPPTPEDAPSFSPLPSSFPANFETLAQAYNAAIVRPLVDAPTLACVLPSQTLSYTASWPLRRTTSAALTSTRTVVRSASGSYLPSVSSSVSTSASVSVQPAHTRSATFPLTQTAQLAATPSVTALASPSVEPLASVTSTASLVMSIASPTAPAAPTRTLSPSQPRAISLSTSDSLAALATASPALLPTSAATLSPSVYEVDAVTVTPTPPTQSTDAPSPPLPSPSVENAAESNPIVKGGIWAGQAAQIDTSAAPFAGRAGACRRMERLLAPHGLLAPIVLSWCVFLVAR